MNSLSFKDLYKPFLCDDKVVWDMYTLFWWEMRLLFINKKVENKNVNPILACSCQQYRFWMAFTLLFHHYPTMKKNSKNYIKEMIYLGWFLAVHLQTTHMSAISLRLHRAMRESDFMLLLFLNIFLCVVRARFLKICLQQGLLSTLKELPLHSSLLHPASPDTPRSFHKSQIYTFKN